MAGCCPLLCTHAKGCVKTVLRHVWKDYEELADDARYTPQYKDLYAKRKETIERVFADAKEKHGMRYTLYRGLAQVSKWVRLKFVAMNLKKLARWKAFCPPSLCCLSPCFISEPGYSKRVSGFFDRLSPGLYTSPVLIF